MCVDGDALRVIHEDRAEYLPNLASVTWARRRVRGVVEKWGYEELALEAELVAAELTGNAVLHGCVTGQVFRVGVVVTGGGLRVEVADPCLERWPQPRAAGGMDGSGRGLAIVGNVTHRWGVTCGPLGKAVWGEFDLGSLGSQPLTRS
jgi:anti-sigma regulatory factor (Ser/Thr protein kinase)